MKTESGLFSLLVLSMVVLVGVLVFGIKSASGLSGKLEQGRLQIRRSPQRTFVQTGSHYRPEIDVKADVALIAGITDTFAERAGRWYDKGYVIRGFAALMRTNNRLYPKAAEISQVFRNGERVTRGRGGFEVVPTLDYIEYLKKQMKIAIDADQTVAVELEEPEWVGWRGQTGYSEAFKKEWNDYYRQPWQAPDSSTEALYRSSKLKYHLVHRAVKGAFEYAKEYAREKGRDIDCVVAAHSLVSWIHDATIGPFTTLCDEEYMDAYRVQVWTLTGGTPNVYRGLRKERPFETEFLEYAEAANMVRPTKMRYEVDNEPLGDESNLSYITWKARWEPGTVASLMFPEVTGYRVIVWPKRQFLKREYPTPEGIRKFHKEHKGIGDFYKLVERKPIPRHYNTESLVVLQAINNVLDQKDFAFDSGPTGVGVIMSDAMLFQRKAVDLDETGGADVSAYYGLVMPLIKHGIRVEPVHLEHSPKEGFLKPYKVLLLEYESQKPQKPEYNQALAEWVKKGGVLLFYGDGSDPFNKVKEWWNQGKKKYDSPRQHLFECLGLGRKPKKGTRKCGNGYIVIDTAAPESFAKSVDGPGDIRKMVRKAFEMIGARYWEQNYFKVERGPYILAKVFDEITDVMPYEIKSNDGLIDLFDPSLAVFERKILYPGDVAFLYDISKYNRARPGVIASASKIEGVQISKGVFSFISSSPTTTRGATRLYLPSEPTSITVKTKEGKSQKFEKNWDQKSSTLFLGYENLAEGVKINISF